MAIKKVKIGPISYEVIHAHDLHSNDRVKLDGWIRYNTSEILIEGDLGAQRSLQVLWHEVVHGLFEDAGIDQPDEQVVTAVGNRLIELIRNNAELVKVTQDENPVLRNDKGESNGSIS